jgi:uncharacterized protein YmfQ (DUF2313 family)
VSRELSERTQDMLEDLPPYLQDDPAVQAVYYAVANEIDRIENTANEVRELLAAQTADNTYRTLAMWEFIFGLPPEPPGVTLADRQSKVKAMLRARRVAYGVDWVGVIDEALAGQSWDHNDAFASYTVQLTLPGTSSSYQSKMIEAIARRITPAHLELNFTYEGGFIVGSSLVGDPL